MSGYIVAHDDTVATEDVAKLEALHMSLLAPAQREMALRDFDNKAPTMTTISAQI